MKVFLFLCYFSLKKKCTFWGRNRKQRYSFTDYFLLVSKQVLFVLMTEGQHKFISFHFQS